MALPVYQDLDGNRQNSLMTRLLGKEDEILRVTATGYVMASLENLEFLDTVDGSAVNTNLWNQSVSGMTISQANSLLSVNAAANTTANAYAILSSIQNFTNANTNPLYLRWSMQASSYNLPANTVMEIGWGSVSTNVAPTDGVFLRFSSGAANLVLNNNGTETLVPFDLPSSVNATDEFFMFVYGTRVKLYMNNVRLLDVLSPSTVPAVTNNSRQPVFLRVYNGASIPSSSPVLKLAQITAQNINAPFNKPYSDKLVGFGRHAVQLPVSGFGQNQNYANSAAPASASLSNTAAGYTTLGGQFQFAAVAGAETDYALFGFQIPAGFQLYITDCHISTYNTGAIASATTPTILQWALGVNSSNVSLATADGAGTWAPRKLAIGSQVFPISSAIGYVAPDLLRSFGVPLCVDGGRFLHVILKMPVAAATVSEVIRGTVSINGYFE